MKIVKIDWSEINGKNSLLCPICKEVWMEQEMYDVNPCAHLLFRWGDETDGPLLYQKLDSKSLRTAYLIALAKAEGCSKKDAEDNFSLSEKAFALMKYPQLDLIASFTDTGMCCGPVAFTNYWGLSLKTSSSSK